MGNPFAVKPTTTVQRSAHEVYPERKGLHTPQHVANTPMDQFFGRLEDFLAAPLVDTTVELLYAKLPLSPLAPLAPLVHDPNAMLMAVARHLLGLLEEVHACAIASKEQLHHKDLLTISLHDMKTFGKLVSCVIVFCVSPALASLHIGVPLEKRRLKDFGSGVYKPLRVPVLHKAPLSSPAAQYAPHAELLQLVYHSLHRVFAEPSDVRSLLLKGSGYSDYVVVAMALATVPYFDAAVRALVNHHYGDVEALAATYDLYQDYTLLVLTASPAYFKQFALARLQRLPSSAPKGDGVLSLIEFVLGLRENEQVDIGKFEHVAQVLLLKPRLEPTAAYFASVGRQCYDILVNINRPVVGSCVGYFLEQLWRRNPRVATDFILARIWAVFDPPHAPDALVLLSEAAVNNNINVLLSLTQRALAPDLLQAVFRPVLVAIWGYHVFLRAHDKPAEIAQNILVSYLTLANDNTALDVIAQNVVADGQGWRFRLGPNLLVEICPAPRESPEARARDFLARLDVACAALVALLHQLEPAAVLALFVSVLGRWLLPPLSLDEENPFMRLVDLRVVEAIGREFTSLLAQTPLDILTVVLNVLSPLSAVEPAAPADTDMDSDDDDELEGPPVAEDVVAVVLQLLLAIMAEAEFDAPCRALLARIRHQLRASHAALTAAQALCTRIDDALDGAPPPADPLDQQRQLLTRAVASLNDPLVPIRAHGLYLLRQLVEARSPVVLVDFVVRLHLVQLKDPDPFVYLNVIKGLESLLLWDAAALPLLADIYAGREPDLDLDERLRVGEVLLRYVEHLGDAFTGDRARTVCDSALSLIQRRGDPVDNRLRMLAMSVLGSCCNTNPLGMVDNLTNALDCALGILQLETSSEEAVMRRAAIVLISDLVLGTSKSDILPFPSNYRQKVLVALRYAAEHDLDLLVREQAQSVLDYIEELVAAALESE